MRLTALDIRGFKNLSLSLDVDKGVNLVLSPNGSGKTNLLESIYLASNGVSFRSYPEVNLIGFNTDDFAKVSASINGDELSVVISRYKDGSSKQLFVNSQKKSLFKFSNLIDTIIFSPDSVDIVSGSPDIRRKDIDAFLSSYDNEYKKSLFAYRKVVRNRNKLLSKLRSGIGSLSELDFWNEKLINLGSILISSRVTILDEIKEDIDKISSQLFKQKFSDITVNYISKVGFDDIKNSFESKIVSGLDKEINAGLTLYGPHRDDIEFNMDGKSLRISGSRGQQRIASLIYKLAITSFLNESEKSPILLLDDVMSELDDGHRKNIEDYLSSLDNQIFITSCEESEFTNGFINQSNLIDISK